MITKMNKESASEFKFVPFTTSFVQALCLS